MDDEVYIFLDYKLRFVVMYMLKCYDHRCTYVSLQPMYLMEIGSQIAHFGQTQFYFIVLQWNSSNLQLSWFLPEFIIDSA